MQMVGGNRKIMDISFLKVPAHVGIELNEWADRLAKSAIGINEEKKGKTHIKLLTKEEKEKYKELYKIIFKVLVVLEICYLNNNINNLDLNELLFNLKIKYNNLDNLTNKQVNIMENMDLDPLLINYNDMIIE